MTDLNALIERFEKASGPDRVLDALIECALRKLQAYEIGMSDKVRSHWRPDGTKGEVIDHQGLVRYHAPDYSFSPTAAMTLIPSGAGMNLQGNADVWLAVVAGNYSKSCRTPGLAISAAALSARTRTARGKSGAEKL